MVRSLIIKSILLFNPLNTKYNITSNTLNYIITLHYFSMQIYVFHIITEYIWRFTMKNTSDFFNRVNSVQALEGHVCHFVVNIIFIQNTISLSPLSTTHDRRPEVFCCRRRITAQSIQLIPDIISPISQLRANNVVMM